MVNSADIVKERNMGNSVNMVTRVKMVSEYEK